MEKQFKTNINCSGCVAQATPFLNEACGIGNWSVDTSNPDKTLTVKSDTVSEEAIRGAVVAAGFQMEKK